MHSRFSALYPVKINYAASRYDEGALAYIRTTRVLEDNEFVILEKYGWGPKSTMGADTYLEKTD